MKAVDMQDYDGGGPEAAFGGPSPFGEPPAEAAPAGPADYEAMLQEARASFRTAFGDAVAALKARAEGLEVRDDAAMAEATSLSLGLDRLKRALEKRRKETVDPPNQFVKAVNGAAKFFSDPVTEAISALKAKMTAYQAALVREREAAARAEAARREAEARAAAEKRAAELRREMEAKAATEAEKAEAEARARAVAEAEAKAALMAAAPPPPEAPRTVRTEAGAAQLVKKWTFRVSDPALVPREYLALDERKVREAIRAGVREIPGLEIYEDQLTRLVR
jgi:hypothetical protein